MGSAVFFGKVVSARVSGDLAPADPSLYGMFAGLVLTVQYSTEFRRCQGTAAGKTRVATVSFCAFCHKSARKIRESCHSSFRGVAIAISV